MTYPGHDVASQAYAIMIRRGWGIVLAPDGWTISFQSCVYYGSQQLFDKGWRGWFGDPFTALVEADKWYKENVEK